MSGITAKDSLEKLGLHCLGTQPWQSYAIKELCDAVPIVVQRGASNLYFANVTSALDIPRNADLGLFSEKRSSIEANPIFATLKKFDAGGPMYEPLLEMLRKETNATREELEHLLRENQDTSSVQGSAIDLAGSEWLALITPQLDEERPDNFITRHTSLLPAGLQATRLEQIFTTTVERIVLVTRLKEVRALRSFSRIQPGVNELRPDLTKDSFDIKRKVQWLPAVEIFGEGLFIQFDEQKVSLWERKTSVISRVDLLQDRVDDSSLGRSILKQRLGVESVSARFLLLHTFAHLLIRELCFECGYSSASLRERIYARSSAEGSPQAGILIYTAAGDSEGTLGGLVRQAEAPRLISSLLKALESGVWCSADPICRESDGQGYDKTNLSACHSCCLLPETSCVCGNLLLDRTFVVESHQRELAFFSDPATAQ